MQALRKKLTQLALAQLCQHNPNSGLVAMVNRSSNVQQKRRMSMDTLYGAESCEDCVESYRMPAAREDLKKIEAPDPFKAKDPCWQSLRRTEYKCRTDPEFMLPSFIDASKKCLSDPCAWDVPRADLIHYRPSDKLKRKYQRTWIKCVVKKRKVKMHCACIPVRTKKRTFKKKSKISKCEVSSCTLGVSDASLADCQAIKPVKTTCPKINMPGCKPGRLPPACRRGHRAPSKCRKRLTKYPAFSECLIDPLPTAPPVECNCLKTPSMCSVWEYFRNKKS